MKKLSKKTKNILFVVFLICAAALTWFACDNIFNQGFEAGEKQGYSQAYKKIKSETTTESELQQAAKEIGVYDEEVAEQQKNQREERNNYWINKDKENTASKTVKAVEFVYITEKGKKYHKSGCQYLRITAIEIDKAQAIDDGYTPCSRCYPDNE